MNVLAPFGFYGWGNIGDESTLQGFARLVRQHARPLRVWVASRDPAHTARAEPSFNYFPAGSNGLKARWARLTARGHVIAGGTPIMDGLGEWPLSELVPLVQSAVRARRPVACVGVGVETLRRADSRQTFKASLASTVTHWSVRSARDRERLEDLGVPTGRITTAADMAWLLGPVDTAFGRTRVARLGETAGARLVIGVNLNLEHAMLEQQPGLVSIVANALDRLVSTREAAILFLCNEVREGKTFDKAAALAVMAQMTRRDRAVLVRNDYYTPQEMLSLIGCCDLTVSSRYHFCVFSALQGVPFVALCRSDKVEDLCLDLGVQGVSLPGLEVDLLSERVASLHESRQAAGAALTARVDQLRDRARANLVALAALTG
jgi:polysaccharide pyruvyl transferase WcaK-like protein